MDYGMGQTSAPFRMQVERDGKGRVIRKVEQVAEGEVRTLGYTYDEGGRLVTVQGEYGPVEAYRYEDGLRVEARLTEPTFHMQHLHYQRIAGRAPRLVNLDRTWIAHDDNGFRFHVERDGDASKGGGREQESYRYAPDYRLLEVRKGDLVINFDHDQDGRRVAKYVNGQLEEQYAWLDLMRMAAFRNHLGEVRFHYLDGEHTPWAMTLNGRPFRIYSDQVGSVRVVADEQGRVVQNIRYCSFGRLLEEANPGFPMPLGFAGGLHDRDVGWVRFGFRDYDPETGRFTAPDPMGYAAGDPDVYGYCLDDPVNNVDPAGLMGGTVWDNPPEKNAADLKEILGPKLRDYEIYTKAGPGGKTSALLTIPAQTIIKKLEYEQKADRSESVWEKQAYRKKADEVSVAGEAINSVTRFYGFEPGNRIVNSAINSTRNAAKQLNEGYRGLFQNKSNK